MDRRHRYPPLDRNGCVTIAPFGKIDHGDIAADSREVLIDTAWVDRVLSRVLSRDWSKMAAFSAQSLHLQLSHPLIGKSYLFCPPNCVDFV